MGLTNTPIVGAQATGTLNIDGAADGTVTGGPSFNTVTAVPGTLSATVAVDAETNTITMEAIWEVSSAGVTWYHVPPVNNAATVVLATGTAGADATVTKVIEAPMAVFGWPLARLSIVNRVAAGLVADTYAISYNYLRQRSV